MDNNFLKEALAVFVSVDIMLMLLILGIVLIWFFATRDIRKYKAASKAKSLFLAHMSHEIRTSLNTIIGMNELILQEDISEKVVDYAELAKHAGENMKEMIDDILDFSKIEADKLEIVVKEYAFTLLIEEVVNDVNVKINKSRVLFTTNIDGNIPSVLIGDSVRIKQILLNLLSNAAKYTDRGQITLTVTWETNNSLKIEVADSGRGIKKEHLENIFDSFTRGDMNKNQNIEGTGLGLAITQKLCQAMGGKIYVKSEYGTGSVFTAIVPQKIAAATKTSAGNNDKTNAAFIAPEARILIVDDVTTNLIVAEGMMLKYKMRTEACNSGKEAVDLVAVNCYDVIFMDHSMPGMDGVEATALIRSKEKANGREKVPIIAMTANSFVEMREMYLSNGFSDFLPKPIEAEKLYEVLKHWIPKEKQIEFEKEEKIEKNQMALMAFCKDGTEKEKHIRESLMKNDYKQYITHLHGLKGTLLNIGAQELAGRAGVLEEAAKFGDELFVSENNEQLLTELKKLIKNIQETAIDNGTLSEIDKTKMEYLRKSLIELKTALEEMEAGQINRIIGKLEKNLWDRKTKGLLTELSECVLLFDYDKAIALINREVLDEKNFNG